MYCIIYLTNPSWIGRFALSLYLGQHCFLLPSSLENRAINSPFLDLFKQLQAQHIVIYPFYNIERDKIAALPQFLALIEVPFIVVPFPPFSTRDCRLSPQALANWIKSLTSYSDCCYHRLSVATSLRSCAQWPLAEQTAGWNLQIQCSRRMVYANCTTTADWLTPVLDLIRASRY